MLHQSAIAFAIGSATIFGHCSSATIFCDRFTRPTPMLKMS
ncbi:hypothetical protein CFP56_013368 [Quercus suber]|uniref:Uncharacterized protein n=1 Tax=Quercus suber TaxID=58331 RepID=A0AAW0KVV1_QUESU